jgi:hypothetical protein
MGGGRNHPLRRIDGDPFHPQRSLAGQETVRRGLWFFHGQKWKLKIPKTLLINHVPPSKGSFEPQLVPKGQTRVEGFDDRIISLPLCPGLSVREIQAHLQELYDVQVSPDLISRVTDALLEEVREWQSRPLDPVYPVIFFDALRVKIRDEGLVRNKAVLCRARPQHRGRKRGARVVDRADRGRQVLAQGDERAQNPRHRRHPDCRSRRAQGISGGDRHGLLNGISANMDLSQSSESEMQWRSGENRNHKSADESRATKRAMILCRC